MISGCFSGFGTGQLFVIEGKIDRFIYLNILKTRILAFATKKVRVQIPGNKNKFSTVPTRQRICVVMANPSSEIGRYCQSPEPRL